jgi:CRP/FNR family transcriptional regulator, cyclic AMP receptor protein
MELRAPPPPSPTVDRLELREPRALQVLKADPALGDGLDSERFAAAREEVVAASASLEPGSRNAVWPSDAGPVDTSLLVVEGLVLRRLALDGRCCSELLGRGDVVRPWDQEAIAGLPDPAAIRWRVVDPTRVAFIDARFIERAGAYPEVLGTLLTRAVRRAQSLAVHLTVSSMPRVDDRLRLLFWHLAARWGTVTPSGVRLDLPLTHELLAELVGAQRPTTTSALASLARRELVTRDDDGSWLLTPPAA